MKPRSHDPGRLDVGAAAADGAALSGQWLLATLERLRTLAAVDRPAAVEWSARFERRPVAGAVPQVWLHLVARTCLDLECQRCLQPVTCELAVDRAIRFVPTEDEAAALDAEGEDDVLALPPRLDLRSLVEDELLLALPLVPRHDTCPVPLEAPPADEAEAAAQNPFAVLAGIKATKDGPGR
jgi:uncharacterized protein